MRERIGKTNALTPVSIVIGLLLVLYAAQSTQSAEHAAWPKGVTVASGASGGVWNIWGGAWAKVIQEKMRVNSSVEATSGPVANVKLVDTGENQLGLVIAGPGYEAWTGTGWAAGKRYTNIRMLFPMYQAYYYGYALAKLPIRSIRDLGGRTISPGVARQTPDLYTRMFLKELGIEEPKKIINVNHSDANGLMRDGLVDAIIIFGGVPQSAILDMETTQAIRIFGIDGKDGRRIAEKYPFFSLATIPPRSYKSQSDPVSSLAIWSFAMGNKDLPDDFVYALLKTVFENRATLVAAHKSAEEMVPEAITNSPVPLHPGAIRFYKEQGIQLSDRHYPPGYRP